MDEWTMLTVGASKPNQGLDRSPSPVQYLHSDANMQAIIMNLKTRAACCQDLNELLEPELFKALADPNRIALLARLAQLGEPCTVSAAAGCCPTDLSVVSRHLATLRQAGILEAEKRGREVYYSVRCEALAGVLRAIAEAIEACCPGSPSDKGGARDDTAATQT
jgi:ArsR family transcriptional regulator